MKHKLTKIKTLVRKHACSRINNDSSKSTRQQHFWLFVLVNKFSGNNLYQQQIETTNQTKRYYSRSENKTAHTSMLTEKKESCTIRIIKFDVIGVI